MPKAIICRKCAFKAPSFPALGRHYREHPEHKLPKGEISPEAQEALKSSNGKRERSKPKKVQVKEVLLRFCPHCGWDLEKIEQAMAMIKEMGK